MAPAASTLHVPFTAAPVDVLHAWQSSTTPPQAVSQQTPSTQWPLSHWPPALQELPLLASLSQTMLPLKK